MRERALYHGRDRRASRIAPGRRAANIAMRALAYGAAAVILAVLALIAGDVVKGSLPAWHLAVFLTPVQGVAGGLANAILGTLWLSVLTLAVAAPVGIATGTFLVEYAPPWVRQSIMFVSDILVGVPSIVMGYAGYLAFVLALGWGFSALAAALTLAAVVLPYIIRNTVEAVAKVPAGLRDAARALGFSRARTVWAVVWPEARGGMAAGVLLAMAVAMGETAPLLYTAEWSQSLPSAQLTHHPVGYLTYVVWTYIQEPYPAAVALAYMAGLLLMGIIGGVAALTRVGGRRR